MIGVLMNDSFSDEGHDICYIYKDIASSIIKYGGIPIPIVVDDYETTLNLIDKCDGIILQGGDNYTDKYLRIINYLYDSNIPTFGICLGMQMMGILFNGKLGKINNHKSKIVNNSEALNLIKEQSIKKSDSLRLEDKNN